MGKHTVKARTLQPGDVVDGMRLTDVREDAHERGTVRVVGQPVQGGGRETRYWPSNRLVEVDRRES